MAHAFCDASKTGLPVKEKADGFNPRVGMESLAGRQGGSASPGSQLFAAETGGVIGLGKFRSRVHDLGSNKKHLRDFGR
jgi:hypothetical protein